MAKLNQIVAVEKGVKAQVYSYLSEVNKFVQKPDLFNGFSKTYNKKNEESEDLPPESKKVQFTVQDVLEKVTANMANFIKLVARKDFTNNIASADIKVDGQTIAMEVPVTHLLFLEKQLTDMKTFIGNLPVLDEADEWSEDTASGLYKSKPIEMHRTKKIQKGIVLYDATDKHPAQTQLITEDVLVGYWHTTKLSSAIPRPRKEELLKRIEKLILAVKEAREEANGAEEADAVPDIGSAIIGYILK